MKNTQTLREAAETRQLLIGAGVDEESFGEESYRSFLAQNFNCLYPSWAFKWDCCHNQMGKFNFDLADRIVDFALASDCKIRLNCLLWHRDIPSWIAERRLAKAEAWEIVQEHCDQVLTYFKGRIHFCDVVNEAISDDGPPRDVGWGPLLGEGWIEKAFRLAHEAAPEVELFYCDYRPKAEGKWKTIFQMCNDFCDRAVPIHGLAVQLHSRLVPALSQNQASRLLGKFSKLPLKIHLPECGVWIPPNGWMQQRQALIYGGFVDAGLEAGAEEIGFWWPTDWRYRNRRWLDFQGNPALPGLFDQALQPKPALHSVIKAIRKGGAIPVEK